jgi:hypothetical protein
VVAQKEKFKMNKGIEILLARMESNPEEFEYRIDMDCDKWTNLFRDYESVLEPEDVEAYKSARRKMLQDKFTSEVMKELLDPKSLEDVIKQYRATGISSVGQTLAQSMAQSKAMSMGATLTANSNTLTIGNQTLDESTIAHMKLHAEYMKAQIQAEKTKPKRWWNKSIPELFGKK